MIRAHLSAEANAPVPRGFRRDLNDIAALQNADITSRPSGQFEADDKVADLDAMLDKSPAGSRSLSIPSSMRRPT